MSERLSGHTLLVSLLATPIRHSLSPKMHNEAYAKLGLDYAYLAFEVGTEQLADAVQGIRALGIRGSNVSMPNKEAILPLLDDLSPAAELVGAVNTVVNKDGKGYLVGHITDGIGALRALAEEGVSVKNEIITLAGVGGAGKAIAVQLAFDGAKEVRLFNRQATRLSSVQKLVTKLNQLTRTKVTLQDLEDQTAFKEAIRESHLFIDATSVGMKPLENLSLITDPELIRPDLVVFDIVYSPAETKLLAFARQHGAQKVINGLGMVLYQGAEAFKLITGQDMPVDAIKPLLGDE
ncbi:TPA: shikimate dehydrogenase [Streptococcus pyogenes]|uniref:shikimate dehydrogenase n=1 Tax=Streptococcus pyogenes TaxID=1314 RepID=UPI0004BE368C|nr:shikimate dehydrogenase [Streptococcus pyogenes]HER4679887.1 shikimate dehydrogenase [Streptococcus pyogenes NGAS340]HER4737862.1 shikimate dehydrogenase [Streptococcus pyogenes NGAS311]UEN97048.1 shikimate dehydrogenase [Streptococcus pyogenes]HEP1524802.1 shikimate dehydrogenase [Streptococcus pyogenes]HEQ0806446.1 shikimate dehydrogenase [Streptococcus pyogenes]